MDKAADGFVKAWMSFVKKCLVPADGLNGLSSHQRLEARRQELKDLLLQKDRLKNRGADVHQRINDRIEQAANRLQQDLDRYSGQVNALATRLMEQKGFPGDVPASFSLATSDAGKSLQALGEALRAPMARAYRLVQDARERSVLAG